MSDCQNTTESPEFAGIEFLPDQEVATMIGVKQSRIKQLIRDKYLLGVWKNGHWWVPADMLIELDSRLGREPGALKLAEKLAKSTENTRENAVKEQDVERPAATHIPIWMLLGTITLLKDARYTDEEALYWFFRESDELGSRPIDAMRDGRHHRVNQVASALAW